MSTPSSVRDPNAATFLGVRTAYNPEVDPKDGGQHEGGIPQGWTIPGR